MGIEEIVDVQISIEDTAVTRAGFGVGLIVGSSNRLSSKVQEFANLDGVDDVYQSGDPELQMATAYFGQDVKPEKVIMAQRDANVAQSVKITIPTVQNNTQYTVGISLDGAANVDSSFTSDGDATRDEIVDGLVAAIAANFDDGEFTLTDNGDDFDITVNTAGIPFVLVLSVNLTQSTLIANRNLATELAEIRNLNDEWYCLLSVSHTDDDIKRGANFIQPLRKIYIASSQNSDIIDSEPHIFTIDFDADFITGNLIDVTIDGIPVAQTPFDTDQATTLGNFATNVQAHPEIATATVTGARQITVTSDDQDVLKVITALAVTGGASQANGEVTTTQDPTTDLGQELAALSLDRTALMYSANADAQFPEAAWAGGILPLDPGSVTWAFKTLAGITVDALTATQKAKAIGNNVNVYTTVGGVNLTQNGTMASGRFIDIRRGVDWLQARMEENIFFQVANLPKIPFTDAGIAIIQNEISAVLQDGIDNNVIADNPEPSITVPRALSVSANDRANRLLPDVKFEARLAGAIHKVIVRGTVSV